MHEHNEIYTARIESVLQSGSKDSLEKIRLERYDSDIAVLNSKPAQE